MKSLIDTGSTCNIRPFDILQNIANSILQNILQKTKVN